MQVKEIKYQNEKVQLVIKLESTERNQNSIFKI